MAKNKKKDAGVSRVLGSLGVLVQLSVTANFIPTRLRRPCCESIAVVIVENVQIHSGRMVAWGQGFVKNFLVWFDALHDGPGQPHEESAKQEEPPVVAV